jgi:uncharacterized RDD family membrane protein YckC
MDRQSTPPARKNNRQIKSLLKRLDSTFNDIIKKPDDDGIIPKEKVKEKELFHVSHLDRLRTLQGTPLAGFRRRSFALGIDMAVIAILVFPSILKAAGADGSTELESSFHLTFESLDDVLGAAITLAYFTLSTFIFNGQTLGKRLMKIRVISLKSEKLTLWQSFERSLGYGASALEAGFGFIQAAWYSNKQAVHDRIAETAVVKVEG